MPHDPVPLTNEIFWPPCETCGKQSAFAHNGPDGPGFYCNEHLPTMMGEGDSLHLRFDHAETVFQSEPLNPESGQAPFVPLDPHP